VTCGTLLTFEDNFGAMIGAEPLAPTVTDSAAPGENAPATSRGAGRGDRDRAGLAIRARHSRACAFPTTKNRGTGSACCSRRNRAVSSARRPVFIGAQSGQVIGDFDALTAPPARKFMDTLFPIHTGEVGGLVGRSASS
jgi:uncharacterized iron-regulated membrane protein